MKARVLFTLRKRKRLPNIFGVFEALEQRESGCPLVFGENGERRFLGSGYLVEVISIVLASPVEYHA